MKAPARRQVLSTMNYLTNLLLNIHNYQTLLMFIRNRKNIK